MTTTKKITLPISPEYCSHWGLWEAVREIWQNALDEQDAVEGCEAKIEWHGETQELSIRTSVGSLAPQTLVLGLSTKRSDKRQRGKFGEGYKLALLVLRRLGHFVEVHSGGERWTVRIEADEQFNAEIMNVYVEEWSNPEQQHGVVFLIQGVNQDEWSQIESNIRPADERERILYEDFERGRVYVGGLYVSTVKGFRYGYAFDAGTIRLDRDRGMVNGFDLAWETSALWSAVGEPDKLIKLVYARPPAPDVEYVESHGSSVAEHHVYSHFLAVHGARAVPVVNQEEIEAATTAGMKWVLVPDGVKALLRKVKNWFIPSGKSPFERLEGFKKNYAHNLDAAALQELDEIIEQLKPKAVS